jgi:hypothetical protein
MEENLPEKKTLYWNSNNKKIKITSLKELLDLLINMELENINYEIAANKNNLIKWVEENFPKKIELITELKSSSKEFTAQQFRESLIRILRRTI